MKRVGLVYDEVVAYSSEEWKRITDDVVRKFVIQVKPNPNIIFRDRKNPRPQLVKPQVYIKPPIGPRPIFDEEE
jgi:hypothetical protein